MKIEMKCEKCGKLQQKDQKNSNENWQVFDTKSVCECGGNYKMYMDGIKVGT